MKFLILLLVTFISLSSYSGTVGHELFFKAHESYDQGEYQDAIKLYPKKIESGALQYNLGNFYYKNGELGRAIFHYKLADRFIPRDADLNYNLTYLMKRVTDKIDDNRNIIFRSSIFNSLTIKESVYLFSVVFLLLWGISLFLIYKRSEWLVWPRRVLVLLLFVVGLNLSTSYFINSHGFGVVITPEAKVYSGIGSGNVALFSIHEGTSFNLAGLHSKNGTLWYKIELNDGKKGWIKGSSVVVTKSS